MSGQKGGRQIITTADWMRDIEKRSMHEGRRPQITTASDLMGPGLGPQAIEIQDWNDEVTTFNGFFFSRPGARNSPDSTRYWMGYVAAEDNGNGYMRVYEYSPLALAGTDIKTYVRNFETVPGTLRKFGAWILTNPPPTSLLSCKISATADQTLVSGTATYPIYNQVNWDTGGMADLVNNRINIVKTGYYRFTARAAFANNATGVRAILFQVSTTGTDDEYRMATSNSASIATVTTGATLCQAGDYVSYRVIQISGANLNLTNPNSRYSSLQVDWAGPA